MLHLQFTSSECTLINLKDLWYQKGQLLMKRPFLNDGFIASVVCLRSNLKNGRVCKRMKSCKLQFRACNFPLDFYFPGNAAHFPGNSREILSSQNTL